LEIGVFKGVGKFRPHFYLIGASPANHFCTDR